MEEQGGHAQAAKDRLAQLRAEVADGLDQARRGELLEGEEVRNRLLEKSRRRRHQSDEG